MRELQAILRRYRRLRESHQEGVLAQVVRVEGSAYRGPGARMLIPSQGSSVGFLSGGCLEDDVRERSGDLESGGPPLLLRYDMTSADDVLWGLGMGCDGVVDILVERVPQDGRVDSLAFLDRCVKESCAAAVALVYQGEGNLGRRSLLDARGRSASDPNDDALRSSLETALEEVLTARETKCLELGSSSGFAIEALIEYVAPAVHLVICGAGYDARPVVEMASLLGWRVEVVDHREALAKAERFPGAQAVQALSPEQARERVPISSETTAVIMTHNYLRDQEWLQWLVSAGAAYVGLLGPRARTQRLLDDLAAQGYPVSEEERRRLYGPVGLDIGGTTPEEIALSILSEIRSVLSARSGGSLRRRSGPINDPISHLS